jgi:hypothetical protein
VTSAELIAIMEAAARTGTKSLSTKDIQLERFATGAQIPELEQMPEPELEKPAKEEKAEQVLDQMRRLLNGTDEDLINSLFPPPKAEPEE